MNAEVEILKLEKIPHGLVELRSDNILVFRPDIASFKEYTVEILQELHEVFIEITDGVPRPYLCDNRHITGIVNKEEQEYINQYFGDFATHAAMLTHSAVMRVIVNGYNTLFKPKVEIRLFKSENEAVEWLLAIPVRN